MANKEVIDRITPFFEKNNYSKEDALKESEATVNFAEGMFNGSPKDLYAFALTIAKKKVKKANIRKGDVIEVIKIGETPVNDYGAGRKLEERKKRISEVPRETALRENLMNEKGEILDEKGELLDVRAKRTQELIVFVKEWCDSINYFFIRHIIFLHELGKNS